MKDLEFVKTLIALLNENDKENVIKRASTRGFMVSGFSNKPQKAPKNIINSNLLRKDKHNKYYYYLILDVINDFPVEQAEDRQLFTLAKEWINDIQSREEIEKELEYFYTDVNIKSTKDKKNVENLGDSDNDNSDKGDNSIQKQIHELEEKNISMQKKSKELREKLQSNRIEIDNLVKDLKICQKERKRQQEEIEKLQHLTEKYDNERRQLTEKLQESQNYCSNLLSEIDILKKYKDNALKIICFAKINEPICFDGYNIIILNEWNDKIKEKVDIKNYSEVWYVHKGFNYSNFIEIKAFFKCKIREYITVKKLIDERGKNE